MKKKAWAILKNGEPLTNQTSIYFDDTYKGEGKDYAESHANQLNESVCNKEDKYTVKEVSINY